MRRFSSHKQSPLLRCTLCCAVFAALMLLGVSGCRKSVRTRDSQLRAVQELLDIQLPRGTPEDKVMGFLEHRGCVVLPSQKPGTVVALIPATDNRENPPIAARVTFYFDANGKLNTFALARASGEDP